MGPKTQALLAAAALLTGCGRAPAPWAPLAEAARIEIHRPRRNTTLVKSGENWALARNGAPADADKVKALLASLQTLSVRSDIAPASKALAYGLGPADSRRVRVADAGGRTLFDARFGRRTAGRSAYYRRDEQSPVALAAGLDPAFLGEGDDDWALQFGNLVEP